MLTKSCYYLQCKKPKYTFNLYQVRGKFLPVHENYHPHSKHGTRDT